MNEIDRLSVLIEANYAGLKAQLQTALESFTSFLDEVNSGQINWTQILQGTFTPALIATIAGTFALSIEQALNFQQAVQGASLNSQTAFQNTTSSMTNGALAVSAATGQSASDVEDAIGQVSLVYKSYNDALTVTNDLSQFATAEHISLAQALQIGLPLLQQWNVSAGDAANVLATLGQSTSFGKIPIQQLSTMLAGAGPALKGLTSLPQAISQLQEASNIPGFTPSDISNMFDVIVKGATNAEPQVNAVFGNMGTALKTGGFAQALDDINNKILSWGTNAQIVGQQFGLQTTTISDAISKNMKSPFADINTLAQDFLKNLQPLSDWFNANQTTLDKFKEAWTTLIADLEKAAMPAIINGLLDLLKGSDRLVNLFSKITGGDADSQLVGTGDNMQIRGATQDFIPGTEASLANNVNNANNPITGLINALVLGITDALNRIGGNSTTTNTTINNPSSPGSSSVGKGGFVQTGNSQAALNS